MAITAERGYLIPAIDTDSVDYLRCAVQLARSIRQWHPDADISVLTATSCADPVFDHVIPLPHGDLGGYANDWQVFHASPYRQTIKLEADMIAASPMDHWWTLFENRDVVISTGARDFYDHPSGNRYYRRVFDVNGLPDVYNAITYWRLSTTAQEFWRWVKVVFDDWNQWKTLLKYPDETPSTDLVYAIVAQIMGPDKVTLPTGLGPQIVHMKQRIIPTHVEDWTQELVWEFAEKQLKINTVSQFGLVHYHVKDWDPHG